MKLLGGKTILALRTRSLNDQERDPFQRGKRVKHERTQAYWAALIALPPRDFPHARLQEPGRFVVHLVRIAPGQPLDAHDNLPGSLKHVADSIAARLGVDDGNVARIRFTYDQERGDWGVRFTVSLEQLVEASP